MRRWNYSAIVLLLFVLAAQLLAAQTHISSAEVEKKVDSILSKMTLDEKIDYLGGLNDFYIRPIPRLGLPAFRMSDGPIGVRNYGPSTTLAGGIALAASWDTALDQRAGVVLGEDSRARGVNFLLGPAVNIYRAPMDGRNFEYFGEDPFLAARTAVAYIEGLQSQRVCATIKHFVANNSEYDRHNVDSIVDERTLREIYLPAFEAAVKQAHVCAIMDSYNLTNGEHMTQNGYLNDEVAKKEWGFNGIIMSDWSSTYDGVAAVNGGLDLEMPSGKFMNRETLLPAIKEGKVAEATIDDHVRRILRVAVEFGWLDDKQTDLSIPLYNEKGDEVALEAARSSMVLLKNEGGLLPLNENRIKTLAVIGPDAYPAEPVGGGSAGVRPFNAVSYMEGIANYLGKKVNVLYKSGIPTLDQMASGTVFATKPSGGERGLQAEFFTSHDLTGTPGPTGLQKEVNYGEEHPLPHDFRSARWSGYYQAPQAGSYEIFLQSMGEEGGARLYLDGKLLIDDWKLHTALIHDVTLNLSAGPHEVRLEAYRVENWGRTPLRLGVVPTDSIVDPQARAIASMADAVIVAVGFDPNTEGEGSDRTFGLPPGQDALIQAMLASNKRVVVVVTSGGGVDMTPWVEQAPAILQSWYSGQEGGKALAELLFGQYSPSGKLPVTFDRRFEDSAAFHNYYPNDGDKRVKYAEGLFLGYRHYDKAGIKPLFPFGYGLSYTTFKYSNLAISPTSVSGAEPVTVSFDLTNTGRREGAEVAELYISDTHSQVPMPVKELKGFAKVDLKPGETRKVAIKIDRRALSYYDVNDKRWTTDPGDFGILVGNSSENIELKGGLHLAH
jgi:beta-glucosidase